MRLRRFSVLPRSLAARTALVLLAGLVVVQTVGLAIHALDRLDFARLNNEREVSSQVAGIYGMVAAIDPPARDLMIQKLQLPSGFRAVLTSIPEIGMLRPTPNPLQRLVRHQLQTMTTTSRLQPLKVIIANNLEWNQPPGAYADRERPQSQADELSALWRSLRPGGPAGDLRSAPQPGQYGGPERELGNGPEREPGNGPEREPGNGPGRTFGGDPNRGRGGPPPGGGRRYAIAMQLPDDQRWLTVRFVMPLADPFLSPTLPVAFLVMTVAAGLLSIWAVRRLTAPLRTLAIAAEKLGRDVNSEPLPENGPTEVATAAIAFNTMATRIRRFVTDRTLLLTSIGHDLRTPITRLKLRAEFIDDEELQAKFLSDLDELEAMVSATLAFGRDSANREPMVPLDLRALLRTVLDDAVDGRPTLADLVGFAEPPPSVTIQARSLALKRALANLVGNAIAYGGGVQVTLRRPENGHVVVLIEDDGPGIASESLDRVFEPFVRIETSRNRETGGTGLGLSIARNIVRGQGGDITLANRAPHGLRAMVTLVA